MKDLPVTIEDLVDWSRTIEVRLPSGIDTTSILTRANQKRLHDHLVTLREAGANAAALERESQLYAADLHRRQLELTHKNEPKA